MLALNYFNKSQSKIRRKKFKKINYILIKINFNYSLSWITQEMNILNIQNILCKQEYIFL